MVAVLFVQEFDFPQVNVEQVPRRQICSLPYCSSPVTTFLTCNFGKLSRRASHAPATPIQLKRTGFKAENGGQYV